MFRIVLNKNYYCVVYVRNKAWTDLLFKIYTMDKKFVGSYPVNCVKSGIQMAFRSQYVNGKAC